MKKIRNKKKKNQFPWIVLILFVILMLILPQLLTRHNLFGRAQTAAIVPSVETDAFSGSGDIADDSAIWYNESNPAQSVVIGDNKEAGIGVFDLAGKSIQFRPDGKIGNVDLRTNFPLGSESIILVGANNRSDSTIALYKLNPVTRQLEPIAGSRPSVSPNYGFCFYKSPQSQKYYAFVTQEAGATMEQYELVVSGTSINTTKVRTLNVGSQSEGCVADDAKSVLYVGEEDAGIWKYGAEPTAPTTRTAVDSVGSGHLTADVEGLAIAGNYLFASSQGDSKYAMYSLDSGAFIKNFTIGANGSIDAVSETDGISAYTGNFNATFPQGIFVAHDATNDGGATSNLKFVPLHLITGSTAPSSAPSQAAGLTPTMHCLGGCPTMTPQITQPPISQAPNVTQPLSISEPPTISEVPCDENTASTAHDKRKHSKHKESDEGFISKLLQFILQLFALLLKLLGGGTAPSPTTPLEPFPSGIPDPSLSPC